MKGKKGDGRKALSIVLDVAEMAVGLGLLSILLARWILFMRDPSISYVFLYIFGIMASVVSTASGIVHLARDVYDK